VSYLNIRQVASYLGVSEKTVYRLLDKEEIPAVKIGRQWRFYMDDVKSWLRKEKPEASVEQYFDGSVPDISSELSINNLLKNDGIYLNIPGESKEIVFKNAVSAIKLEPGIVKNRLLSALIAREELCSTGIGQGVALPHPRHKDKFKFASSSIFLCFLENKIDFDAIDHIPVGSLFFVFAKNEKEHLHMLRVLATLFLKGEFISLLEERNVPEILNNIKQLEDKLNLQAAMKR